MGNTEMDLVFMTPERLETVYGAKHPRNSRAVVLVPKIQKPALEEAVRIISFDHGLIGSGSKSDPWKVKWDDKKENILSGMCDSIRESFGIKPSPTPWTAWYCIECGARLRNGPKCFHIQAGGGVDIATATGDISREEADALFDEFEKEAAAESLIIPRTDQSI